MSYFLLILNSLCYSDTKKRRRLALTKPAKDYSLSASRGESCDEDEIDCCSILEKDDDPPDRGDMQSKSSDCTPPSQQTGFESPGSSLDGEPLVIKPDFDTSYGLHDILTMNGSFDSMIDMPLFHEVDSLMTFNHEDHLNDTVFYLPMSYPLEGTVKLELPPNLQVANPSSTEVTKPNLTTPDLNGIDDAGETAAPQSQNGEAPQGAVQSKGAGKKGDGVDPSPGSQSISAGRNSTEILADSCKSPTSALEHMLVTDTSMSRCSVKSEGQDQDELFQVSSRRGTGCELSDTSSEEELGKVAGRRIRGRAHSHPGAAGEVVFNDMNTGGPDSTGESPIGSPESSSSGSSRKLDGEVSPSEALNEDCQEIDRFVICSDITMECVLCSFSTDSYSAFKSHIICSHPCWRITKKLSKNRLLVEKSVRNGSSSINTKLVQALTISSSNNVVSTAPSHPTTPLKTTAGSRGSKDKKDSGEGTGKSKRLERNPRKKQLLERNKRLFKCTLCLRLFVFEGSVVNHVTDYHFQGQPYDFIHISNNHGLSFGPIYRCQQQGCYFSCESEDELERHQLDRHTQVIYRCQLCGFTADSAVAVHSHGLHLHQQQLMCSDLNANAPVQA